MTIEYLDAKATNEELKKLIAGYDEFHWSVAWGSMNETAVELLKNSKKITCVTFGIAFSHSDPEFIKKLQDVKGARVVRKFSGGTFHPKVYGFKKGQEAVVLVGSANFTDGGLGKNNECTVKIVGKTSDTFFRDIFGFTKSCFDAGEPVTSEFAQAYEACVKLAQREKRPSHNPMEEIQQINTKAFSAPLLGYDWQTYISNIKKSDKHDLSGRLKVLHIAQKCFSSVNSYSALKPAYQKFIAGLPIPEHQKLKDPNLVDGLYGWFGSMKGMGDFAKLINNNDKKISKALGCIPLRGDVGKENYENFVKFFLSAFKNATRTGGVPTASRLLALKRPDVFVCICGPNITKASKALNFPKTKLDLDNYWERVVQVIRLADWYNAPKPIDDKTGGIWEYRAAMLDAIFYDP